MNWKESAWLGVLRLGQDKLRGLRVEGRKLRERAGVRHDDGGVPREFPWILRFVIEDSRDFDRKSTPNLGIEFRTPLNFRKKAEEAQRVAGDEVHGQRTSCFGVGPVAQRSLYEVIYFKLHSHSSAVVVLVLRVERHLHEGVAAEVQLALDGLAQIARPLGHGERLAEWTVDGVSGNQ